MEFGIGTYGIGYLAGVLSTLSPCVLPLVPIVLGSAVSAHRWGAMALAGGLVLSFTTVGILIATIGASIGLNAGLFRDIAVILLIGLLLGVVWSPCVGPTLGAASTLASHR